MSGRSPRPDFGRTDYRFKINDNFGMLHETTLAVVVNVLVHLEILHYNIFAHMSQFPDCHILLYRVTSFFFP